MLNTFLRIAIIIFKAIFLITIGAIAGVSGVLLLVLSVISFNQILPEQDPEFYEILTAVPDYFIIVLGISLVLTIIISFLTAVYVMFNKKSNSYVFMLLIFLWFVFIGFTIISIPGVIIHMQDLNLMPNWIDGNYSFIWKWNDGVMLNKN